MLTKVQVKKQLGNIPEEFSLDNLVEQLIVIQKTEKGLKDSEKID
ncbi:hypothetical protein ACFSKL_02435 [Belliella marina]|uniref:Uncharacterized protein n=1 Tax=Belliella marina TaxID=1644146 RepID=A0ABW4VJB1_9BACT